MTLARYYVNKFGKDKINSLTKYPSILTLHKMGDRGILTEEITTAMPTRNLHITEKIDGTNVRLIFFQDYSYLIGSRDQILYHSGDLYYGTDQSIVDLISALIPLNELRGRVTPAGDIPMTVIFGELYGGKLNGKIYGQSEAFRAFDVIQFHEEAIIMALLSQSLEEISHWREHNSIHGIVYGQPFMHKSKLADYFKEIGIWPTPVLWANTLGFDLTLENVSQWIDTYYAKSRSMTEIIGSGKSEGIIVSSEDRKQIVKIRFEDYNRAVKLKKVFLP